MSAMRAYREIAPPGRLAGSVECFWTMRQSGPGPLHRVVPDGCADILFTELGGRVALEAVGPMTGWRDFAVPDGQSLVGVRFRPGTWTGVLRTPGDRVRDLVIPLEDLWGRGARELLDRMGAARSGRDRVALLAAALPPSAPPAPLERALAWLEDRRGRAEIGGLARQAGLSPRQFRRLCVERSGLAPKFLARVLRFRHAARLTRAASSFAVLALECGYYDQAHCINEFRALSGRTPASFARGPAA